MQSIVTREVCFVLFFLDTEHWLLIVPGARGNVKCKGMYEVAYITQNRI